MPRQLQEWSEGPLFCLTSDVDWASDYCLEDFLGTVRDMAIVPTVFATHKSDVLDEFQAREDIELGIHPNFLPGSSHGNDVQSVIAHSFELVPNATCFRSHCYVDSTEITTTMVARGINFDSNICLYLQPNLAPLNHWSGIQRLPVFWEDDIHWHRAGSWNIEDYKHQFETPGLKILNIHPFFFALNIPSAEFYATVKPHIPNLTMEKAEGLRHLGKGSRTFAVQLLEWLAKSGHRFVSLGDIQGRCENSNAQLPSCN